MAINGIGSRGYGNYYNYQSSVNSIRLQQALARNPKYVQAVEAVNKVGSSFTSSSMDFLKRYSSTMSDVMQSANSLRDVNSSSVTKDLTVTSSDTAVATATERYSMRTEKDITVDVNQLAAAQQNVSEGISGSAAATADMDFTVESKAGSVNVQVNALKEDGSAKTNREMLRDAAKQINKSDAGVLATVKEKDGVATLELTGRKTGSVNSFSVSGDMGAASGAQNIASAAQNAEYVVTEGDVSKTRESASNNIQLEMGRIGVTLKSTGSATISSQVDSEKIASSVSDLLNSYNKALTYLNNNAEHGSGVYNQIAKFANNLASGKTLEKIGITTEKDGTLSLDKDVLKKALKDDPSLTKELISGSYGIAQTAFNRASSAMTANSASLINNDLKSFEQESMNDPFNFMNLYSRSGAYNMNNYYSVGLMMNFLT